MGRLSVQERIWVAALLLLIAVHSVAIKRWAAQDQRPLAWDQAIHTKVAYQYQERWASEGLWGVLRPAYFNYPPLYHLSLVPFLNQSEDIADAGTNVNIFYLSLLLVAVFLLGTHLMGPLEGFTAALILSGYPIFFEMVTQTMIEVALTAWVTLAVYFLLKSEQFSHVNWSLAFGVTLGLGMLTKWTALAYVSGPLVWCAVESRRLKKGRWMWAALGVAGVLIAPWYLVNFVPMMTRIQHLTGLPPASGVQHAGILNLLWYPLSLFDQMSLLYVLLLLPGLAALFWRPRLWPLFLWFVVSLILFTCIHNRNSRYSMPALPAAALLSVAWVPSFRKAPWILLNIVAGILFFMSHFSPNSSYLVRLGSVSVPLVKDNIVYPGDWKHDEIIDRIRELRPAGVNVSRVLTISNSAHFHSTTLDVTLLKRNIDDITFRGPSKRRWFEFADFILLKTGDLGPDFTIKTVKEASDAITQQPDWFRKVFKEKGRWPLPDGSEAILYQQDPDPVRMADTGLLNISLQQLDIPNIHATGVSLRTVPISAEETSKGRLEKLIISCKTVAYKMVQFENVSVTLIHPQINLPLFLETQELEMLHLESLRPQATVSEASLLEYAAKKAKWLKAPRLLFDNSAIEVSGKAGGIPIHIRLLVKTKGTVLYTEMEKVRLAGIPLPKFLLKAVTDRKFDLKADDEKPYNIEIAALKGGDGKLTIN